MIGEMPRISIQHTVMHEKVDYLLVLILA